jgi:transposase InsO family protein
MMCRVLEVSRSAYYEWAQHRPNANKIEDEKLKQVIQVEFEKSRATYGTRRLKKVLENQSTTLSRQRIGRLMGELSLRCKTKKKFKATTYSKHDLPIANNILQREFDVKEPNKVYAGDITYIWTREGWLYLAVVIDLFSRQVVGWSMAARMQSKLVNDALMMAVWARKPVIRAWFGTPIAAANMRLTVIGLYWRNTVLCKA